MPQRTWIGDQTTIGVSELFHPLGDLGALERSMVNMTMTTSGTNAAHRWNFFAFLNVEVCIDLQREEHDGAE